MKTEIIFKDLKQDLQSINERANERLLKEEQVRSSIFYSLKKQGYIVAAERNFNKTSEIECDLVFWNDSNTESWMEIKTARYSNLKGDIRRLDKNGKDTWNNNQSGQFQSWKKDIEKLKRITNKETPKYFVLVEQCFEDSVFDKIYNENLYDVRDYFEGVKYDKIEFELKWNKAPVDKCIVRIFDFKNFI
jgi:hypothetical protein